MNKPVLTRRLVTTIWLAVLVGALAIVFISTGCSPVVGREGARGTVGRPGAPGQDGNDGVQGPSGAPGSPGLDATPVTVVSLCPGSNSYPGVFIEVSLCIQDELYAVYSSKGGLLVKLSPGNYTSDSIGSACNLTVHPHCIVSH